MEPTRHVREKSFKRFMLMFRRIRRERGGKPITLKELCGQFHSVCGVSISPAQAKKYLDGGAARRLIMVTNVYFDGRPSETLFSLESEPQWPSP